jgi:hypothetical protein
VAPSGALHRPCGSQIGQTRYLRKKYAAVKAPNSITALSFDDYMLFSRALVRLTPLINERFGFEHPTLKLSILAASG